MNGDDAEIAYYVCSLLEHGDECDSEDCPLCATLHSVLELIRTRLFGSPLYPKEALAAGTAKCN